MGFTPCCWKSAVWVLNQKLVGIALTVEGEPTDSDDRGKILIPILRMLGDVQNGDVIVIQPHDNRCAHLGELSCETAKFRGREGRLWMAGCEMLTIS